MPWVQIAILVVSMVIAYQNRPKLNAPKPAGLSDIRVPRSEDGAEAPVIFGTVLVENPNIVYYGDLSTTAIKK